jgi:hypothetical protein
MEWRLDLSFFTTGTNLEAQELSNIDAPSCNHCCRRKAVNIAYSECVSVKGKGNHLTGPKAQRGGG